MSATLEPAVAAAESRHQAEAYRHEEHGWRLAAVTAACLISVFLDQATSGMVGAAQPYMTGTLGGSSDEGLWLTIGYTTCYYLSLIVSPYMIGRFGRRSVWIWGHALFAISSLLIAVTGDFWTVVLWRTLQGIGQGTFFVCAVMTILRVYPTKIAFIGFAIFASTSLSGPAAASAIGGWFVDENAWQTMFVMMALLASLASLLVYFVLRDPPDARITGVPLDPVGLSLALLHYFTFNYIMQEGERRDWLTNPTILGMTIAFVVFTAGFIWWELRGTIFPFIKMRLFAIHNLRFGALLGFVLGVPLFGATVFLQYLESGIDFSSSLAGAELALRICTIVLVVPFVAYSLSKRLIDPRYFIVTGFLLVSVSYWLLYFGTTYLSDFRTFIVPFVLQGVGFSMLFSPIASTVLTSIPPEDFTRGVAIFKLTLAVGGSFASTLLGVVVDHRNAAHLAQITENTTLRSPAVAQLVHAGAAAMIGPIASLQSTILSYADTAEYTAIIVLLAAPAAIILRPPARPASAGTSG
jgi:DHA2 family multidrug resistance protein